VRVVLNHWLRVVLVQLVVSAVDELLVVWIMLDDSCAIFVMDGKALRLVMRVHHLALMATVR